MIRSDSTVTGFAQRLPHQRYPWDDRSTPILERYELDWQIGAGRDCHGVVVRVFDIYYAYIESRDHVRTTERWAREPFQTAAAARAWVQDQLFCYSAEYTLSQIRSELLQRVAIPSDNN
jgi:hypothetical protein